MNKNYRVLYFGNWGYGKAGVDSLLILNNVDLLKVFTKYDENADNLYLNQVYETCKTRNIEIVNSDKSKLSTSKFIEQIINSGEFDFIIACCFDRIFKSQILKLPIIGAINVHPSNLPKYRGIKPLENALANSETQIGVTIHELIEEIDAGDIVLQRTYGIRKDHIFKEIYDMQCDMINELISDFFKEPEELINQKKPQNTDLVSFAPRLAFEIHDTDTPGIISKKYKTFSENHLKNS